MCAKNHKIVWMHSCVTSKNCKVVSVNLAHPVYITFISHGVPPLWGVKQGRGGKTNYHSPDGSTAAAYSTID